HAWLYIRGRERHPRRRQRRYQPIRFAPRWHAAFGVFQRMPARGDALKRPFRRLGGETLKCALRFGLAGEDGDDVARPRGGLALLIDGKSGEGELTGRVADEFVIRE